jgi:phosphoribosylaminoimidazole carboxylase PurE protein
MTNPHDSPLVGLVIGSRSDEAIIQQTESVLNDFNIPYELSVLSAHRTPKKLADYASSAKNRGLRLIVAAAGGSAALPGAIAAWTTLPVIGIPVPSSDLKGIDALLTIAQMPPGVPVACMAVGIWGARNAGYFAVSIIASNDPLVEKAYDEYKADLANR